MFPKRIHELLYKSGLLLLAASLPLSKFLISVATIAVVVNWLLQGEFKCRFSLFLANKPALVFVSVFLLYLIGVVWSGDAVQGADVLKSQLPLLLITLVVTTSPPLSDSFKRSILTAFIGAVLLSSIFTLFIFISGSYSDVRELSPFISHIRLSLMVILSVFSAWKLYRDPDSVFFSSMWMFGVCVWLVAYLMLLQSLSGIVVFFLVLIAWSARLAVNRSGTLGWIIPGVLLVMLAGGVALGFILWNNISLQKEAPLPLETHTDLGNPYLHDTGAFHRENGHRVYIYLAEDELREAWNRDSDIDYLGNARNGQQLRLVLIRYMTSLGLNKDAEGLASLTRGDKVAVERGLTNYRYRKWPWPVVRLHQSLWEVHQYRLSGNSMGHSLAQRLVFWEAGWMAFLKKPIIGWGSGSLRDATRFGLEQSGPNIDYERWMKPHNQYLTFLVMFGVAGLLWILLAWFYPVYKKKTCRDSLFLVFCIIILASMTHEDTLDNQVGYSFFVFFYNYFVFIKLPFLPPRHERVSGKTSL